MIGAASRSVLQYKKTGRSSSLAAYDRISRSLPRLAENLPRLLEGEEPEHRQASRLAGYMRASLSLLAQYAASLSAHDPNAQRRIEQSPTIRRINGDFAPLMASLTQSERETNGAKLAQLRRQTAGLVFALVALCAVGIIVTLAVLLRYGGRITRRLQHLASNARRLAAGEPAVPVGGDDEIAQLDAAYNAMARQIRLEHDRSALLQRALLPKELPTLPGLRVDVSYAAASEAAIGGDWYDVFNITERKIGISIGDVAGHGLDAAALMSSTRHAIRTVAYLDSRPAAAMRHVNEILCRNGASPVTALYATFDLVTGTLEYCLAGHPRPMFVRTGGSVQEMPGEGLVLGVEARSEFRTESVQLDVGSAVVLYTDGLLEPCGDYLAGVRELRESIEAEYRNGNGNLAKAIQDRLLACGSPRDDCALMFIGVTALGEAALHHERVAWDIDARLETSVRRVKRAVLWHLGEIAVPGADLSTSEVIMSEMLGNVARHTPGPARVVLEWKGETAMLRVCDEGPRFDPPAEQHAADLFAESGRGIFVIRAMSKGFTVEWTGEGNCVSAVLPLRIGGIEQPRSALATTA